MDPWLFPNLFEWSRKEYVMPPTLIIKTGSFEEWCKTYGYDAHTDIQKLYQKIDDIEKMITINKTGHLYQMDLCILQSFEVQTNEFKCRRLPRDQKSLAETYLLNSWL